MDNQPTQPGGTSPETPTNTNSGQSVPTEPTAAQPTSTPTAATPPTGLPATDNVVFTDKKSRKKGPIIALISILAVLLIGGGAFAAAYIINNQPVNILMSSLNNFLNAEQVEVDGSINLALQNSENIGVESLSINFDDKAAGVSNSATATLNVNFTNGASAPAVEFGEVLLNNGVLYIEANGLEDFYDQAFRDNIKTILMNQALYGTQTTVIEDCSTLDDAEYVDCLSEVSTTTTVDPAVEAVVSQAIDEILDQIGKIIGTIDGQWIEISIDDVMNSEMLATVPSTTRQTFSDTYKCTVNTLNHTSDYAGEFTNLYNQNSFINMTSGSNSFYNISFDAAKLAGYLNGVSNTKFASDLSNCFGATISNTTSNITADNVANFLEYVPQISAKFDGFFDHHLTELKLAEQNDNFSLDADLKFSYPNNITVNAPANSRPVMDVVNEVYQGMEVLQNLYTL